MANHWDIPPLPKYGDRTEDETFLGVGRVMTQWESVEFDLARLYSVLLSAPDDYEQLRRYGEGRIFRDRLDQVKRAADTFFVAHPGQDTEGGFLEIETYARGFADRRNDVAHGIVFKVSGITAFIERMPSADRSRDHYALIPPLHTLRKHDEQGFPFYVYTLPELMALRDNLVMLGHVIQKFRLHLLG